MCYSRFAAARQLLSSGPAECRQRPSILEVRYYYRGSSTFDVLEERFKEGSCLASRQLVDNTDSTNDYSTFRQTSPLLLDFGSVPFKFRIDGVN